MYICNLCNYETSSKSNINLHNKTKKHIINKDIYDKKEEQYKDEQFQLLNSENEKLKQKLVNQEKQIIQLETKVEIYKELSEKGKNINNNNGIIINANTNNLNYLNKHCKKAPPLKKISNFILNGIDLNDDTQIDKLTDTIIYSYNNKCLHKLIGDHIIKHYKKDDLELQSFYATDVSRRKYLIKIEDNLGYLYDESSDEIDHYNPEDDNNDNCDNSDNSDNSDNNDNSDNSDNSDDEDNEDNEDDENKEPIKKLIKKLVKTKSKWINDNDGVKISYLLLDPIINKIIRQLKKKCRNYNNEIKKHKNRIPTMDEMKKFQALIVMMKNIDTNKLNTNINSYIGPHFTLVKK